MNRRGEEEKGQGEGKVEEGIGSGEKVDWG